MGDNWFKIHSIYAVTSTLQQYESTEEDDEDDVLKRIRLNKNSVIKKK